MFVSVIGLNRFSVINVVIVNVFGFVNLIMVVGMFEIGVIDYVVGVVKSGMMCGWIFLIFKLCVVIVWLIFCSIMIDVMIVDVWMLNIMMIMNRMFSLKVRCCFLLGKLNCIFVKLFVKS